MQLAAVDPFMDKGPTPHLNMFWVKVCRNGTYDNLISWFSPADFKATNFYKKSSRKDEPIPLAYAPVRHNFPLNQVQIGGGPTMIYASFARALLIPPKNKLVQSRFFNKLVN